MEEPNVTELITLLRIDIARLDTKIDGFKDMGSKVDAAQSQAREAILGIDTQRSRINDIADNQKWLWRTTIASLIVGGIGLLWRGIG